MDQSSCNANDYLHHGKYPITVSRPQCKWRSLHVEAWYYYTLVYLAQVDDSLENQPRALF